MSKSAEAFRTIGEVAEELDVPKHVLRFWEGKFPQIRPMKRGGGRRYYRPEDMELLRGIRHLLHAEGYTIKGVQKILREQGIEQVKTLVREALSAAQTTGGRGNAKKGSARASKADGPAAPAGARPQADVALKALQTAPDSLLARSKKTADIIKSVIRELEQCRALLGAGAAAVAEAQSDVKRARAGGRT